MTDKVEFQYCYLVHSDDELYHHGVKGMHWGVRRYQNENGSLTPKGRAKLKEWQGKEIQRRKKGYYKLNKALNKRAEKLINKRAKRIIKGKNTDKISEKIRKNDMNMKINKALEKAEVKKIKSMNLKDVGHAKRAKAAFATKQVLKHIGKTSLGAASMFLGFGAVAGGTTIGLAANSTAAGLTGLGLGGAGMGGGTVGTIKTHKTSFTSKRRFSNLSANERAKIMSRYYNRKSRR